MDKQLSPLTHYAYSRALKKLEEAGYTVEEFGRKPAAVYKYIQSLKFSASYTKLYLSAILHAMKQANSSADISFYQKKVQELLKQTKEKEDSQRLHPAREAELLPWPEITALRGKVMETYGDDSMEYIIYCLYTLNPPVRLDYTNMKIVKSMRSVRPGKNYCVVTDGSIRFVFQEYKTSKKYGKVVVEASKELREVLEDWVEGKEFLLPIKTATTLGRKVVEIFKECSGKSIGVSLLRHSYITWFLGQPRTIKEKKEIAKKMMHSKELQEQYHIIKGDSSDSE